MLQDSRRGIVVCSPSPSPELAAHVRSSKHQQRPTSSSTTDTIHASFTVVTLHPCPVADPKFHNGGRTFEGDGSGRGLCPLPPKKLNFYLKMVGFGAFYDYFLHLCKNWSGQWGAAAPHPLDPPLSLSYPPDCPLDFNRTAFMDSVPLSILF